MADFAITVDVADRWRPLTPQETSVASALLADASALLRVRFPGLDARVDTDPNLAAATRAIAAAMVLRILKNPDNKVQESIEDYAFRRADAVADGALFISPQEASQLAPAAQLAGAYSVSLNEPWVR